MPQDEEEGKAKKWEFMGQYRHVTCLGQRNQKKGRRERRLEDTRKVAP
jgi:hypothetical protein